MAALELDTGDTIWLSDPNAFNIGPFGVAVDDDRVYALDGSVGVQALDRETGEQLWATDVTATDTTGIDIQPVIAGDLVIVSSVPVSISGIYTGGDRGVVTALDRETGEVRWEFDTVEGDDLWGNPEVNSGGGAWYPPAVDLERGLVYVGVANPAPFPGTPEHPNGTSRPGDNLYTDSVVALDLATGALEWFHQVTPHDIFDRDQVHAQLVELADGTDVVVSSGKSGVVVGRGSRRRHAALDHRDRRSTRTTTSPSWTARPPWRRAPTAACSPHRRGRTAWCTCRSSTRRWSWSPTRWPTSAPT